MKLNKIRLQDFGPYTDTEIVFDQPLSIFKGANGQGKTKLAQAFLLSLSQQCSGTDAAGSGAMDKIRLGADKAFITADFETARGPMQLVTTYGPGKARREQRIIPPENADLASTKALVDGFKLFLSLSKERFNCVLDPEYFINEKQADQKAILAALVLSNPYLFKPTDAQIAEAAQLEETTNLSEKQKQEFAELRRRRALTDAVERYLGLIDWRRNPVTVIDEVYGDDKNGLFNARKQMKIRLAAVHVPSAPEEPKHDVEKVQLNLTDLRAKHLKESKKLTPAGTSNVGRLEQSIQQQRDKLSEKTTELNFIAEELKTLDSKLISEVTLKKHQKIAALRPKLDELQKSLDAVTRKIDDAKTAQSIFQNMVDPVCPECTQEITPQFVKSKVREFQAQIDGETEQQNSILQEQKALGDVKASEDVIAIQKVTVDFKVSALRNQKEALDAERRIDETIKKLEIELEQAKAEAAQPVDTSAMDAVAVEIQQWEKLLAPAVQYESTLKQIEEAQKVKLELTASVVELERLCAEFGKDGLKARLIAESIGAFMHTVNDVLEKWGYKARLSIEPYVFEVMTPKNAPDYLPLKELSGFEKRAFAAALQSAIAIFSKIKIVMIDGADIMIGMQRNRLYGTLKLLLDSKLLDQVIIMVADESMDAPAKEGVGWYRVESGSVTRLLSKEN